MSRWVLSFLMLVIAAALGPAALAHGGHHTHHGHETAPPKAQPAAQHRSDEAGQFVMRAAHPDVAHPCHGKAMPGGSCCCPVACAALIAPLGEGVFTRSHRSCRLYERHAGFRDLRHGPPLPPPRG